MRMESGALIKANLKLRREVGIAQAALRFYSEQNHFDTVHIDGDPPDINRTRILDNGGVAEEALSQISG